MRRPALLGSLILVLALCTACRPLYLPPVPEPLELPPHFEADAVAEVTRGRPSLRLLLRTVPAEGWLAVQWFAPNNREVASESVRVAPEYAGRRLVVTLPEDVYSGPGRWRAVLSFEGTVVRQLSVEVPSEPGPEQEPAEGRSAT
jgi:hypothetical protein